MSSSPAEGWVVGWGGWGTGSGALSDAGLGAQAGQLPGKAIFSACDI